MLEQLKQNRLCLTQIWYAQKPRIKKEGYMKHLMLSVMIVLIMLSTVFAQYQGEINLSTATATFTGAEDEDVFGHHVAIVPDLNGDGYDEVLVTAPLSDLNAESMDNGRVYLFYGSAAGLSGNISLSAADAIFHGAYAGNEASHDAFGIGDIDNDGYNDLGIAIKKTKPEQGGNRLGKTYIFFGSSTKLQGTISLETADASIVGNDAGAEAAHIKGAGDLDNDGYDDIMIGSGFNTQVGAEAGKIYVFFGRDRNEWQVDADIETFSDASFLAESAGDWAGHRVSGLGDVNGDGYDDILIGANHRANGDLNLAGETYLVLGKARDGWAKDVSLENADASWIGDTNKMQLGWNVSQVGDVDGDGLADILTSSDKSQYYLILAQDINYSSNQPISSSFTARLSHTTTIADAIGHDISGLGDLNQDGFDDFLIGSPNVNSSTGETYLLLGRDTWPATLDLANSQATFVGENPGDYAGFSASGAGDVNNDGQPDILISAYKNDDAGTNAGKAYLFFNLDPNMPNITVTSPNGGETLTQNTTASITWTSQNVSENVKIEYSVDNGITWDVIAADTENDGLYDWLVPDRPFTNCLVRVVSTPTTDIYDVSDGTFEISGSEQTRYRIEAEDVTLSGGYVVETRKGTSNGKVAKVENGSFGTLTYLSELPTGNYDLFVRYSDETDGRSTSTYKVNNATVEEWQWDAAVSSDVYEYRMVGTRTLNPDDEILLYTLRDNGEYGRVDYFEFVTTDELPEGITVKKPNGGETWLVDSDRVITWLSQNTSGQVDVELSRDDGTTWELLGDDVADNGMLPWTVTTPVTEDALIRVTDSDGSPSDVSDASFTIAEPPTPVITVTAPNGGESWQIGTSHDITWNSEYTSGQVKVELSRDAGSSWETLATQTADDGLLNWSVTGPASEQCWVRVSDVTGVASDSSDAAFAILNPPSITITTPNGGEVWQIGSQQEITWQSENVSGNVNVKLSRDSGSTWETLAEDTANDGSLAWDVTAPASNTCLVQVDAADGSASDTSDAAFEIEPAPSITVTAPNGGEVWDIDTEQELTWNSINVAGNVNVKLSRDNGATWETLAADTQNDGSLLWDVTQPASKACMVQVEAVNGSTADISDAAFTIQEPPQITVTAPNGGEVWDIDTEQELTWNSINVAGNVNVKLSRDNGATWETLAADTQNDGSLLWDVTQPASKACMVQVEAVNGSTADISDAAFTIQEPPQITVTAPNGGEVWEVGSQQEIAWTSRNTSGVLDIELSRDLGATWETLASSLPDTVHYLWSVSVPASDSCLIKVSDASLDIEDQSDAAFSIVPAPDPVITVTKPNGGELWDIGTEQAITWFSQDIETSVIIELTRDNGGSYEILAENVENSGAWTWTVTGPATDSAKVRIQATDESDMDVSDTMFSIKEPLMPELTVTAPNGGELWEIGLEREIQWTSTDISATVDIMLSRDGGTSFTALAESVDNTGSYMWNVTGPASDSCLIKISATDGAAQDVSDALFVILDTPTLTLVQPNGGESWQIGSEVTFEWTSTNTSGYVKIQLTRNNGVDWVTLADSIVDNGTFIWTVTGPVSNTCLALVSDVDDTPIDISDAVFKIVAEPSLTVVAPNGGEEWEIGRDEIISWRTENVTGKVKLEISRDNGSTWTMLAENVENTGSWNWTFKAPAADECLIRASAIDGSVSDVSDAPFSIDFPTGVARMNDEIPTEFALEQNYPNPFNPETRITYQLPERSDVTLQVYNVQGSAVATLVSQTQAAGTYMLTWNGKDDHGNQMPSGVYFYRISAENFNETKRMMLMK